MLTRVMVIEPRQLVREGLAALLAQGEGLALVGQAGDGSEGVEMAGRLLPDVVVMGLQLASLNAPDVARRIAAASARTKVLCLAADPAPQLLRAALDAGVRGILGKDAGVEELMRAIRSLDQRRLVLAPSVARHAMDACFSQPSPDGAFARLTPKERQVVQLLAEGLTTKQVAGRLSVSFKTVATHREHAMGKLGLRGVADLTRYAIREGLATP